MLSLLAQVTVEPAWYSLVKDIGVPGAIAGFLIYWGTQRLMPKLDKLIASVDAQTAACTKDQSQRDDIQEALERLNIKIDQLIPRHAS